MSVEDRDNRARQDTATPQRRRRRFLTRRNAVIATIAASIGVIALILLLLFVYRLGYVDRYVANQIIYTFSRYGIRAEIKNFHATWPPKTVEMLNFELYDSQTGEKLGKIDRVLATISVKDLYAFSLNRNIDLEDIRIEGLEAWVTFDEQGRSNFRNIRIPPPETNRRILLAYTAAHIEIQNGVIHYGDARHEISGEARNLKATIEPKDPNQPTEQQMHPVVLSLSDSTFTYDGRPVNNIDVQARVRVNEVRAEIDELVLRSPVAEARLQGVMDDWRALRYQMNITSTVDLTQLSEVLQPGATLRGAGNFVGTVTGEGDNFKVNGEIKSDALAADGVRLRGLTVTATASGQGKSYNANGRAVAELLAAGDYQLNTLQLVGNVMGTGSDFRWVGELRAAAAKAYGTTLTGLILSDARAELKDDVLTASASQLRVSGFTSTSGKANGVTASDIRVRNQNNVTTATIDNVKAGTIVTSGARVDGITANKIDVDSRGGTTNVVVKELQVGATNAAGAEIGNINIAGARFSIREGGRIEGSTADIDAGAVKFASGQAENVKLARPVFVVEPWGRYRASADLSIGGGVLGKMELGQVQAKLVATSTDIQLLDFKADAFRGQASGNARIALVPRANSHVAATFSNLDISGPLAAFAGGVVPLSGRASGTIDLTFPGTDFKQASGTLTSQLTAEPVEAGSDRIPISGEVALQADRGLFQIARLDLQTPATKLTATGQFSFEGDSNLQVNLNSSAASELQAVLISSGLLPEVEDQMRAYGIELAGELAFNGTLHGKLRTPDIDGRLTLGSLLVNNNDLGSLSALIVMNPDRLSITDGRLSERDGGGMQFTLIAPLTEKNQTTFTATLDKVNAAALLAALPLGKATREQIGDTQADVSGEIKITGIPNAMSGSADLTSGPGRLAGEPLESLTARATFNGSDVKVETVDIRLAAGHIVGNGSYNTSTQAFNFDGRAEGVQLDRLAALSRKGLGPALTGTADFTASVSGNLPEIKSYQITFKGQAQNVTINGRPAGTLALEGKTQNQQLDVTLTTGLFGTDQVLTANVNLADESLPATIETNLNNVELANLFPIILPQSAVRITGRATGSLTAKGPLINDDGDLSISGLQGTANLSELTFRVEDVQLTATSPFVVQFSPNEIVFEKTQFTGPGTNITLGGTLAVGEG
ncbi:MAG TPA: AsmA-like C-terminal region-containing protein, partial [Pyrinomonadaceae bacterium]|nr:AsmA-like C-terminal region-containing protein [Pyrinomonadaceae bacterium]